jgi:light-regulated signal transduction histidine kinase (bacteriophytochrome)
VGLPLQHYMVAVLLSALALMLMVLLEPLMEPSVFLLFVAAVAMSALYGGLGPGLVAALLSALGIALLFVPPPYSLLVGLEDALRLSIFLLVGLTISLLADRRKKAEERLHMLNEELERRVAERTSKLGAINEELRRSNTELEQLAYVASHDLQEPLRMVSSYTQLLARRYEGKLDEDADEFIDYAVDGANRMEALLNDLLAYSRVSTRGQPHSPTDMDAVFDTARANLRVSIEESGAEVTADSLPTVMGDESQIVQLFQNLIDNAIKFRSTDTPRVHVGAEKKDGEWLFSVRDNGIGIEEQYLERIFVIFQRLHSRTEYPGTGIGLTLCRKIVERHGGKIWAESAGPGKGSTFYFTLRAAEGDQREIYPTPSRSR